MPQFAYRAKKGPDAVVDGTIEALSLEDAVEKLDVLGLLPVHIEEKKASAAAAPPPSTPTAASNGTPAPRKKHRGGKVRSSELTLFARQLSGLIKAGVPILRALWIISEQTEGARFKQFLAHAQEEIRNGRQLSSVLTEYPSLFSPIYVAMVRAGEDSGTLDQTLLRVSEYRKKQEEVMSKVRSATVYPALMLVTGIGTIAFMLAFVIPKLEGLFSTMGEQLPLPTRILMGMSNALRNKTFFIALGVLLAVFVALIRMQAGKMKLLWSHVSLKLPVFKDFILKAELARFSRTLELLIKCGISILKALEIASPVFDNLVLRDLFSRTQADVAGGSSLGKSLKQFKIVPVFMSNLITVGEETGNLDGSLSEVAAYYEAETDEAVKTVTSLMEPILILGMGLAVGFIVIAMLLPMFELNMAVK